MYICNSHKRLFVILCHCVKKLPDIKKHALLMSPLFGSIHHCEQVFTVMKSVESRATTHHTDEHLEESMRIVTTEIKPEIERLLRQKQCQISHERLLLLKNIIKQYVNPFAIVHLNKSCIISLLWFMYCYLSSEEQLYVGG
jgi:hypothetical protein